MLPEPNKIVKKMYIAVHDDAPDYMVPTLVAHSILTAHMKFMSPRQNDTDFFIYHNWLTDSFRKVVVRVNAKEFEKIRTTLTCHEGHENTICDARPTCLVVLPVDSDKVPNVLSYAKLWAPKPIEVA